MLILNSSRNCREPYITIQTGLHELGYGNSRVELIQLQNIFILVFATPKKVKPSVHLETQDILKIFGKYFIESVLFRNHEVVLIKLV